MLTSKATMSTCNSGSIGSFKEKYFPGLVIKKVEPEIRSLLRLLDAVVRSDTSSNPNLVIDQLKAMHASRSESLPSPTPQEEEVVRSFMKDLFNDSGEPIDAPSSSPGSFVEFAKHAIATALAYTFENIEHAIIDSQYPEHQRIGGCNLVENIGFAGWGFLMKLLPKEGESDPFILTLMDAQLRVIGEPITRVLQGKKGTRERKF